MSIFNRLYESFFKTLDNPFQRMVALFLTLLLPNFSNNSDMCVQFCSVQNNQLTYFVNNIRDEQVNERITVFVV